MAKLRAVNGMNGPFQPPRSEEEFLGGAPIALPENRSTTTPDETRSTTALDETRNTTAPAEMPNDGLVAVTIRVPPRLKAALIARATADQRSISQIAWRLLAPLLEPS